MLFIQARERLTSGGCMYVIAHYDLADQPQRGAVGQNDVDAGDRRPAADEASLDLLVAGGIDLPRVTVAVIEAPHAAFIGRQGSAERDADAVIARRHIDFALAVALAGFQEPAGAVDAEPVDDVARPTAAVAVLGQEPLGRDHAIAAHRTDVALEVGLAAEQAKAALHFPLDVWRAGGFTFRAGNVAAATRNHDRKGEDENRKHSVCAINRKSSLAWRMGQKCEARRLEWEGHFKVSILDQPTWRKPWRNV